MALMQNGFNEPQLPLGFGMALMQDADALKRYATMSATERSSYIEGAKLIRSKEEMQRYVHLFGRK
jgi:hypothetical protein